MCVDACSSWGILSLFIYAAVETWMGRKRPLGAGSLPELLFIGALLGMILLGLAWVRFKERKLYERS